MEKMTENERCRAWYAKNSEKRKKKMKEYYKNNKEYFKKYYKEYYKNNKEYFKKYYNENAYKIKMKRIKKGAKNEN